MASNPWSESSPTDTLEIVNVDNEIVKLRLDVRERLAIDHKFLATDDGGASYGRHKQVTFDDDIADPGVTGDIGALYTKKLATGSRIVPFFQNSVDGVVRVLLGDANAITWFYSNVAPVGWKAAAGTPTDVTLAVSGGSQAYNVNGGTQGGTWTVAGITADAHTHQVTGNTGDVTGATGQKGSSGTYSEIYSHYHPVSLTSATASVNTITSAGTWRPTAAVGKLYAPDLTV